MPDSISGHGSFPNQSQHKASSNMNPGSDENNFNSSSSRRVSFAATAHVRLFEKDSENFKDSQKLKEMENEINLIYNPEKM